MKLSSKIRQLRRTIVEKDGVYGISPKNEITLNGRPCTEPYSYFDVDMRRGESSCHNALQLIAATFHN